MPRPDPSSSSSSFTSASDPPYPTPSTSPLLSPTRPSYPSSSLYPPHDAQPNSAPTLVKGPGRLQRGQSILGQLLASHKPSKDHDRLGQDAALSLETIRPQEQKRRSILPSSWTMALSKAPLNPLARSTFTAPHVFDHVSRDEPSTMLPSVWLETILSGLCKANVHTEAPHYATLPRVPLQEEARPPPIYFANMGLDSTPSDTLSNRTTTATPRGQPDRDRPWPSPAPGASGLWNENSLLVPRATTGSSSRRGSACEVALGEDARGVFQQNRPRTLSSAVISSSIVPQSSRQRSLDSSATNSVRQSRERDPERLLSTKPPPSPSPSVSLTKSATTTTTRGRFTIESSGSTPTLPMRTRTLSTTSSLTQSGSTLERPSMSFSLPSSSPMSPMLMARNGESRSLSGPSFPGPPAGNTRTGEEVSKSGVEPILIPRGGSPRMGSRRPGHERTHSSSSVQSTTSTCSSRRSQVIIPPPPSTSSFQFASFSSISSTPDRLNKTDQDDPSAQEHHVRQDSQGQDKTRVHPLEQEPSSPTRPKYQTHQTMHRVDPHGYGENEESRPGWIDSRASTSSQASPGLDATTAGYFRQRSLSSPHLEGSSCPHLADSPRQCHGCVAGPTEQHLLRSGETTDVVMVKKSATGRMFTVERAASASPTRCSRFIVVSPEEEAAQAK